MTLKCLFPFLDNPTSNLLDARVTEASGTILIVDASSKTSTVDNVN